MVVALTMHDPSSTTVPEPEPEPVTVTEEIPVEEYAPIVCEPTTDNKVLKYFEGSDYEVLRWTEINGSVTYEVQAKRILTDPQKSAEELSTAIAEIWNRPNLIIRVMVLNNQDSEMVDFIAENGTTTYNRRKEK